jgi:poly-gamma-glutamate synthesis protein (capsule biosynthesis protein)
MKGKQRKLIGLITALCILFTTGNYIEYADYKAAAASEITTPANNTNQQVSQAPEDNITPMISQAPADNTSPQLTPVPAEDTKTQETAKTEQKKEYTGRILLNKKTISLEQGKSFRLSARLSKKNQSGKNITYKSSNTKVITVTQKGFLKAVHFGTATVTATLGKVKAVCKVTVTKNITITISAAGDCTLSSDIKQYPAVNFFAVYNEHKNDAYFFKNVKPIFDKDDMTIVNFEGTLSNRGSRVDKKWAFRGKPSYINILKEGSIEAVAFANNHVVDYGKDSYLDTISSFKKADITYSSYSTIGIYKVKGIKIGMISIQEVGRSDAADILRDALKKMKAKNPDLLIVSFHWGIERTHSATKSQTDLSRMAINGGADLVLGHHPHVLQPVEKYKNSYIVYSLGNFCFGGNTNPPDKDTMIYQQTFTFRNDKLVSDNNVRIIPCSVSSVSYKNNYQPTPSKGKEKSRIRNKINGYSRQYGISFDKNGKVIVK